MNKFLKESKLDDLLFKSAMDFWDSKKSVNDFRIKNFRLYLRRMPTDYYQVKGRGDAFVIANIELIGQYKRFIKKIEAWAKKNRITIIIENISNPKLMKDSIKHGYKVIPKEVIYGEQTTYYKKF